jgi:hypothetical protein
MAQLVVGAHPLQHLEPVDLRHGQVEHHCRGRVRLHRPQRIRPMARDPDPALRQSLRDNALV